MLDLYRAHLIQISFYSAEMVTLYHIWSLGCPIHHTPWASFLLLEISWN